MPGNPILWTQSGLTFEENYENRDKICSSSKYEHEATLVLVFGSVKTKHDGWHWASEATLAIPGEAPHIYPSSGYDRSFRRACTCVACCCWCHAPCWCSFPVLASYHVLIHLWYVCTYLVPFSKMQTNSSECCAAGYFESSEQTVVDIYRRHRGKATAAIRMGTWRIDRVRRRYTPGGIFCCEHYD